MTEGLRYANIRRTIAETPWAILPSKLVEITEFIAFKAAGGEVSVEEIQERFGAASERRRQKRAGKIAVLPMLGTISHRMNLMTRSSGGESVEALTASFRELVNDPAVDAIVLDVDSPGGAVSGIDELSAEIYRARGTKPITAVSNALMASAAYWLASSADEIVVTPSGRVGSIGVIAAHEDQSALYEKMGVKVSLVSAGKYKTENNPFEPMTDEGRAAIQQRVDESYDRFVAAVARNRGVPIDTVRNGFGEGRVVGAREAVALGMADRIATLDEVIATMPRESDPVRSGSPPGMKAGLVAVPYEDHGQRVLADLTQFIQATQDRVAYRRVERGRKPLSQAQRERLNELAAGLSEASSEITRLLAQTDPDTGKHARILTQMRWLALNAELSLMDVNIERGER